MVFFVNYYVGAFCDLPVICLSFSAFLSSATSLCDKKIEINVNFKSSTRLHSSRMHIARLLTVSPSMHCTGG